MLAPRIGDTRRKSSDRIAAWFDYVRSPSATESDENLRYLDPDGYVDGLRWTSAIGAFDRLIELREHHAAPVDITVLIPLHPVEELAPQHVALNDVELLTDPDQPAVVYVETNAAEPPSPSWEEYRAPAGWTTRTLAGDLPVGIRLYRNPEEQTAQEPYRRALTITARRTP